MKGGLGEDGEVQDSVKPLNFGVEGGIGEDGEVRDCRTWEPRDYTLVTDNPDHMKVLYPSYR